MTMKKSCKRMSIVLGIVQLSILILSPLIAQNCKALKHYESLTIAKYADLTKLSHVSIEQGNLIAASGFKFVQERDSHTFVLLPDEFSAGMIDFRMLMQERRNGGRVLNATVPVVQLSCTGGEECQHQRCARNCVSCAGTCINSRWRAISMPTERVVIIPTFR